MNSKYQFPDTPVHWVSEAYFPNKLEERLVDFAVQVIQLSDQLPKTRAGNHLGGQIVRSGTAPALLYGEAQAAESRKDFIHKMKIALKELRETLIALQIIKRASLITDIAEIDLLSSENNELISIFVKSVVTAQKKIE